MDYLGARAPGYSWARDCQGTKKKYGGSGAKYWCKWTWRPSDTRGGYAQNQPCDWE